jgi:hypothetical protein
MCKAGYRKNTEAIRPANELRFEARWKPGPDAGEGEFAGGRDRRTQGV